VAIAVITVLAARLTLGAVFLAAVAAKGLGKGSYRRFAASVRDLPWLPDRLAGPAAAAIVVAETATVALLAGPPTVPAGLGLAAGVLGGFVVGLAVILAGRARVRCRCFGGVGAMIGPRHLVRAGLLLLAAIAGLTALSAHPPAPDPPAAVVAGGIALIVAVVLIRLDDLAFLITGRTSETGG
jgi:hypothetical protein